MARYLILWEVDMARTPEDPKERKAQWSQLVAMVKEELKKGKVLKEFGEFLGQDNGYIIAEGKEQEVHDLTHRWVPFVKFEALPVVSINVVDKTVKGLA